jgi:hypothetical protein
VSPEQKESLLSDWLDYRIPPWRFALQKQVEKVGLKISPFPVDRKRIAINEIQRHPFGSPRPLLCFCMGANIEIGKGRCSRTTAAAIFQKRLWASHPAE